MSVRPDRPERRLPPNFDIADDYFAKDPPLDPQAFEQASPDGRARVVVRDDEPPPKPKRGRRDAPRP